MGNILGNKIVKSIINIGVFHYQSRNTNSINPSTCMLLKFMNRGLIHNIYPEYSGRNAYFCISTALSGMVTESSSILVKINKTPNVTTPHLPLFDLKVNIWVSCMNERNDFRNS